MPLTLVRRSGIDTLGKLEASALLRMREAEALYAGGQRLGAVYLYGYVIETSLKTAYYRVIGLVPATLIDKGIHRGAAEDAIRHMPGLPYHLHPQSGPSPGHHVIGWARLLDQKRTAPGHVPLGPNLTAELHSRMQDVFKCWVEFLRYRANRPYNQEVQTMRDSARWIRRHYRSLWS
jgi:hypothetical protein